MKCVATKTTDQLDLQALHRVRERLASQRAGIINQIRAFLLERGIAVRQGRRFLLAKRTDVLSPRMVHVIEDLAGDWHRLDDRIDGLSDEIEALAQQDPGCKRLMTASDRSSRARWSRRSPMAQRSPKGATSVLASDWCPDGSRPRSYDPGQDLKQGNRYLGVLFVQAAWVVLIRSKSWEHYGLKQSIEAARKRLHSNVLAIALANKLARIAWGSQQGS